MCVLSKAFPVNSRYSQPKPIYKNVLSKEEENKQLKATCVMDYFTLAFYYAEEVQRYDVREI